MGFIHSSSSVHSLQDQGCIEASRYIPSGSLENFSLDRLEPRPLPPEPSRLWLGFVWTLALGVAFWVVAGLLVSWLI